jgi:hypothetical protein
MPAFELSLDNGMIARIRSVDARMTTLTYYDR